MMVTLIHDTYNAVHNYATPLCASDKDSGEALMTGHQLRSGKRLSKVVKGCQSM